MIQIDDVRVYLMKGKTLTPIEALAKFGCFRLAAIIFNLRAEGFTIDTELVCKGKKKWASYSLTGYKK